MKLGETPASRLAVLGGLYFAQGIPWGFVTVALAQRLVSLGEGPEAVGRVVAVATLPWTLKPLFGPLVDRLRLRPPLPARRGGALRAVILLAEAGMALALVALAAVDARAAFGVFLALVLVESALGAVQDVAADALALALLPSDERGRANGVMSAGKYAGVLIGGPGLAAAGTGAGWTAATLAAAALLLLPAALVFFIIEPPAERAPFVARKVLRSFRHRAAAAAALFAVVAGASDGFLYPLLFPLLRHDLGYGEGDVNLLVTLAGAAGTAGALGGGLLSDRLGRRRAIALAAVLLAATHAIFALAAPLWRSYAAVVSYGVASGLAGGILYAGMLALFMDLTNPAIAATHFQAFMALLNLRGTWAPLAGGRLAATLPAPACFGLGAALELLPLALLPLIAPRRFPPTGVRAPRTTDRGSGCAS